MTTTALTGIFCKIDWFSAMFEGSSINDVLDWLHIDHERDEFFENNFSRALGYDTQFVYGFNGVSVAVSYALANHFALDMTDISVFDYPFTSVRLDISGTGLNFLRDVWVDQGAQPEDFDLFLRTPCDLPRGHMHITRCDFAFDLVDYRPDFIDVIIKHLNRIEGTRVPIMHTQGGLKFSIRTGDQKTVYLGSPRSNRMLRIYDKRMQCMDDDGLYNDKMIYHGCSSWIRIELQLRNDLAQGLCWGEGDWSSIFYYIYENYCFRDLDFPIHNPQPVSFWDDLFDWSTTPPIVQNLQFAPVVSTLERAERFVFGIAFRSICILIAAYKKAGFLSKIDEFVDAMQSPDADYNLIRKCDALKLSLHNSAPDQITAKLPGIHISDGKFKLI